MTENLELNHGEWCQGPNDKVQCVFWLVVVVEEWMTLVRGNPFEIQIIPTSLTELTTNKIKKISNSVVNRVYSNEFF